MILQKSSKKSVCDSVFTENNQAKNWEHDAILNWMMKQLLFHVLFWNESMKYEQVLFNTFELL